MSKKLHLSFGHVACEKWQLQTLRCASQLSLAVFALDQAAMGADVPMAPQPPSAHCRRSMTVCMSRLRFDLLVVGSAHQACRKLSDVDGSGREGRHIGAAAGLCLAS